MANSPKTMEIATACSKPRNDGYIKFSHTIFYATVAFYRKVFLILQREISDFSKNLPQSGAKFTKQSPMKRIKIRIAFGNFVPRKETRAEHTLRYVSISATAEWCKSYRAK